MNDFVASLSERNRNVFVMRYLYTESVGKIASELHMSENNVSVILARLKTKLRAHLAERGLKP